MKNKPFFILLLVLTFFACQEDHTQRNLENARDIKKKELVFANINKAWGFVFSNLNSENQHIINNWKGWNDFKNEAKQKPKSTIGAFQQKAKTLSKKMVDITIGLPYQFNNNQVKSRLKVLTTKINSLDLYLHLHQIPDQKVITLIKDINTDITSVEVQIDEVLKRSKIKVEEGEQDLIQILNTSRAIPTVKANIPAN